MISWNFDTAAQYLFQTYVKEETFTKCSSMKRSFYNITEEIFLTNVNWSIIPYAKTNFCMIFQAANLNSCTVMVKENGYFYFIYSLNCI